MTVLSKASIASTLLQKITSPTGADAGPSPSTALRPQTNLNALVLEGSADKSASSTMFNAVVSSSETQDRTTKAVLDYIEREYMNFEKKFANFERDYGQEPSSKEGLANLKAGAERLKQAVLADPAGVVLLLEQQKMIHPDASSDSLMGFMLAELGGRIGRPTTAARGAGSAQSLSQRFQSPTV